MRYVVVGAGAIGGTLAARLAQHSPAHPPLLVARGATADTIERSGYRLRSPDDDVTVRVEVARTPAEARLRTDDVLVLATKTHQAPAALQTWVDAPVVAADADPDDPPVGTAGELLPILALTNGVAAERMALRLFERVLGACVWLPATHLVAGETAVRIAPHSGTFIVGAYPPGAPRPSDDADRAILDTLADDWGAATFTVHAVDDVLRWKHRKLLQNLANALQALLGADGAIGPIGPLASRLVAEAEGVYRASGIAWATDAEEDAWRGDVFDVRPVPGMPDVVGGSSWQSVARGDGSIETDYLNGEIVLLARLAGMPAPLNATVQRLARQAAVDRRPPSSMTPDDLARLLDLAEGGLPTG
ncbi:2-dehydropantoate 2-reductase [Luteimicrobium album]|uniref:2-dehydropantoate 2-reductase n=1 Tax=Luteimicrobium album TaxID=1054550 RepID=A0ABQ6HZP8_9MICO|nr:2-dehydropantoate 2-reductase N-terminal domain-containing protein [Luteimicrobium album]GMA23951.1 2-dehydropantoate 2-reductase [Luteimicrobium album]